MSGYKECLETYLEQEEFISSEEYLRRREAGTISPEDVEIVPPNFQTRSFGGFRVKLKTPRYRVKEGLRCAW